MYQGGGYGDVEFPSQAQDQSAIDQVLGISAATDSMTGSPLPAPSSVTVSVMNGTGAYNQATDTATALAALGFHTVGVGDTAPVGDVAETVVYYGSRSPADRGGGRGGGPVHVRLGHHGLRPEPGDRRRPGDRGDRHPVRGQPTAGRGHTHGHRRSRCRRADHADGPADHHLDDLAAGVGHRGPVGGDHHPPAVGPPVLPGRRQPTAPVANPT